MVSDTDFHEAGIPVSLLGCKWHSWTRTDLRRILDHYGSDYRYRASKLELMRKLNELCQRQNLTSRNRHSILRLGSYRTASQRRLSQSHTPYFMEEVSSASEDNIPTSQTLASNVTFETSVLPLQTATSTDSETTDVECTVCLETLSADRFSTRKVTSSCQHEPNVCLVCLCQSIATQFTGKFWNQICCPSCNERLEYHDIKAFADAVIFEK